MWISTAAEALRGYRVGELTKLAKLVCASPPKRKDDLVELLLAHLEGDRLRELWACLDEAGQSAVAEAVHASDRCLDAGRFRAKYGCDPGWGSIDPYDRGADPSPLWLFLYGGAVPGDLHERLAIFVLEPQEAVLDAQDELPATVECGGGRFGSEAEVVPLIVRETELAAQHDLNAVLRLVAAGRLRVSESTRRPAGPSVNAVASVLEGGDFYPERESGAGDDGEPPGPIKAFAWPLLVQAAGFARPAGTRLELTNAGRKALAAPAAAALRAAWTRWLGASLLDELRRIESIKGQSGRAKRSLTAPHGRRATIADALAEQPVGSWVSTNELFRYMHAAGHDFQVARDRWRLYICEPEYGSLGYDGSDGWNILEARYALCLLFEYAATLGLVDVAYVHPAGAREDYRDMWGADDLEFLSRYDGLSYVRLNPLGAYCLGVADEYSPPPLESRAAITVLGNLEVAATGHPLTPGDRSVLDRYAEPVSDFVWRLERERLLAELEGGGSIAELREFLVARTSTALPDVATRFLDDASERAGRLTDRGAARLIECADPALATLIANDSRTRRLCMPAGERHLVVPEASERRFRGRLRKLGYTLASTAPTAILSHGAQRVEAA